jgi:hypothetical protein
MGAGVGRDVEQIADLLAEIDAEERRLRQTLLRLRHARELLVADDDVSDDDVTFIDRVTPRHGHIFARECRELVSCEELYEALEATAIMEFPVGYLDDHAAQDRYNDIAEEILARTLEAARDTLATAFVEIATDVLASERKRQNRDGRS